MPNEQQQEPSYPSLSIIYEFTKEQVARQFEQISALDGKANFVLGDERLLPFFLRSIEPVTT